MFEIFLFNYVCGIIGTYISSRKSLELGFKLHEKVFTKSLSMNYRLIALKGSGYYSQIINNDTGSSLDVFSSNLLYNTITLLRVIPILLTIYIWDKNIFIIFIVSMTSTFIYHNFLTGIFNKYYTAMNKKSSRLYSFMNETLDNLMLLNIYNYIAIRLKEYRKLTSDLKKDQANLNIKHGLLKIFAMDIPSGFVSVLLLIYCFKKIQSGEMLIGRYLAITYYYSLLMAPVEGLKYLSESAVSSSIHIKRVLNFYNNLKIKNNKIESKENRFIEVENLSLVREERVILSDISFKLKKNSRIGIVGLSGEGKSSLISCLLGLESDFEGKVKLLGNDIAEYNFNQIFANVEYLPQKAEILNKGIVDNLVLGRQFDQDKFEKTIRELNLEDLKGRELGINGSFISGGEKSRINIGRFIYSAEDKSLFVIDEPFTGLDSILKNVLLKKLKKSIKNTPGLIISHDLDVIKELSSEIIVLHNNKISCSGSYDELLQKSNIFREINYNFYKKGDYS
ncbi:MAG: hypothetical protein CSB55_07295 [Candidatus Cloacimonadota bacterium]|nr:MAG: hypothetical protein CSB55_07295 [Candidatus Cloacimonadota bacterium]